MDSWKRHIGVVCCILAAFGVSASILAETDQISVKAGSDAAWLEGAEDRSVVTAVDGVDPILAAADSALARSERDGFLASGGPDDLSGDMTADYTLSLDTIWAELGEGVVFNVFLDNAWPLQGFNLLVSYDPTAFWTAGVSAFGTRSADFEYFDYQYDEGGVPGQVRVTGIAALDGGDKMLPPGSGSIAAFRFKIADDIGFAGIWVPIRFLFFGDTGHDNTLTDAAGETVDRGAIDYNDGWIAIEPLGAFTLGDVNLNGVGVEVSDYVYFTNYFMDPYTYPLNAQQLAASDLNRDRVPATIADLVTLINMIVEADYFSPSFRSAKISTRVDAVRSGDAALFRYDSDFDLGGALLVLRTENETSLDAIQLTDNRMSYLAAREGRDLRVFVYSLDGEVLPAGQREFMRIDGLENFELVSVDASSADGRTAAVSFSASGSMLPAGAELKQNYPNPFNPDTHIDFTLTEGGWVQLEVLDLLGRRVQLLAEGDFPAGEHSVMWDGRNNDGEAVATGVYFYRLETDGGSLTRKMMLMK